MSLTGRILGPTCMLFQAGKKAKTKNSKYLETDIVADIKCIMISIITTLKDTTTLNSRTSSEQRP